MVEPFEGPKEEHDDERRGDGPGRRQHDSVYRPLAWAALVIGLVVASVAALALGLGYKSSLDQADKALNHSNAALQQAAMATRQANKAVYHATVALVAVKAEADGLCTAIDYDRAAVDKVHGILYRLFKLIGQQSLKTGEQLTHATTAVGRRTGRIQTKFGKQLLQDASSISQLHPIDCQTLTAHPLRYVEPPPYNFRSKHP